MTIIWPGFLAALICIPLVLMLYLWMQRRKRKVALRYSSLALVRAALPGPSRWRRYFPPALFLLALASLVIALARPAAILSIPTGYTTVLLVLDVSASMQMDDIIPTRLTAAQAAALSFVRSQKSITQIGIVAFSDGAQLVQAPTTNEQQIEAAIRNLTLGAHTAIGSGILEALNVIAQKNGQAFAPVMPVRRDTDQAAARMEYSFPGVRRETVQPAPSKTASAQKAYAPEIIVLLTDGSNNAGPHPTDVAQLAADLGVRIYTIGYGPVASSIDNQNQNSPSRNSEKIIPNTGVSRPDNNRYRSLLLYYDAQTLQSIARMTGGETYSAGSEGDLKKVFASLPIQNVVRTEAHEISVAFVAFGGLLAAAAMMLAALWHPLP